MSDTLRTFHLAVPVHDLEEASCEFLISPRIRFAGEVGEQATMFLYDPSGNALEFKSFADTSQLFAT